MANKKNNKDKDNIIDEVLPYEWSEVDENVELSDNDDIVEDIVIEEPITNNKKKVPYMNDKGLIKIRATRPAYNMIVGQIWERPGHIADNLVREGVAEYIEFIEV